MSRKKEINIFIENIYEDFAQSNNLDLDTAKLTQDAVKMTEYFLSKPELVKKSCLEGYDFSLLYFDIVFSYFIALFYL